MKEWLKITISIVGSLVILAIIGLVFYGAVIHPEIMMNILGIAILIAITIIAILGIAGKIYLFLDSKFKDKQL